MTPFELAAELIDQGYRPIPLGQDGNPKRPMMAAWQKDAPATQLELDQMNGLWANALNVGVAAGLSGLCVLDLDTNKGDDRKPEGRVWYNENKHRLPRTLIHKTPSGGYHLIYRMPKNHRVGSPAAAFPGVDVRGHGGQIVWPAPWNEYEVFDDHEIATLPDWVALEVVQTETNLRSMSLASLRDLILMDDGTAALHDLLRTASWKLMRSGPADEGLATLEGWLDRSRAKESDPVRWQERYDSLPRLFAGAVKKQAEPDAIDAEFKALLAGQGIHTRDDTWEAPVGAPGPSSEQPRPDQGTFHRVDLSSDLFTRPLPATQWVIEGLLEIGAITGLAGWSNVGKTRWLISTAIAVASGLERILGAPVLRPGGVLIVSREERTNKLLRRLRATLEHHGVKKLKHEIAIAGAETSKSLRLLLKDHEQGRAEVVKEAVAAIMAEVEAIDATLIIFDPLVGMSAGVNENSAEMDDLMQVLRDVAGLAGVAVAFLHHTPKGDARQHADWYAGNLEAFRGSGAIAASLDLGFTISRIGGNIDGDRDGRRGLASSLGAAECRRWLRFIQCKGRETLIDTTRVYYLFNQEVEAGDDIEGIGVLQPRSEDLMRTAAGGDNELALERQRGVGHAVHALFEEAGGATLRTIFTRMREMGLEHRGTMTGVVSASIKEAFPLTHDGWDYDLSGTGSALTITRVVAVSDDD